MESVFSVKSISKSFKNVNALKDVSLEIKPGEIFGLLGPDGAGKSTLLYIAGGLMKPDAGEAYLLGANMLKNPDEVKPKIGFLPQGLGLSLAAELSIEENMDYFARINNVPRQQREKLKNELLSVTKLSKFRDRQAKNLSGGMKQKLGLCCTLIHSPQLVFLDEPTTGVDPISRRDIWYLINKIIKEREITIILTTSYMDEAERCHRSALMHEGEILAIGDMEHLTKQIDGKLLEIHVNDQQNALNAIKKIDGIKVVYPMGHRLNAIYSNGNGSSAGDLQKKAIAAGIEIKGVEEGIPTLEDIFLTKVMKESGGSDLEALEEFFGKSGSDVSKNKDDLMIEVKNLYKYFGKFAAVDNVSFYVKRGEIFGFLGPNGAGKTTTIKMLCGLYPPSKGTGKIGRFNLMKEQFGIKKSIGYMSQKFSLYRDLTVGENVELYAGIYGVPGNELKRRKELILRISDLSGKDRVMTESLPMGIKQRLALGCAIIHKPEVIFLDEPTSGVDPVARRLFWDNIFFLARRMGVTILVTTHYMDEAEHCDRLSLMHMGKLIALGSPDELKDKVNGEIGTMFELLTESPFETMDLLAGKFGFCNIFGRRIHLYTTDHERDKIVINRILEEKGITLLDIREKAVPFEDVFVYFCEKAEREAV
ncbi:MAG: ATP-binding cassette domain-containing protein [Firmicutes bacterium]|nr:ATP-binding cassette domain-containing protein [Bacillota bacterium]